MLLAEDDNAGDIFECKLGNLPARETAILTMSYVVELSATPRGEMRFILPTVLNPRYFPGRYKTDIVNNKYILHTINWTII